MAYMSQERKAKIAAALKAIVPKSWKYSLGVDGGSSIVFNLREAPVDFMGAAHLAALRKWNRQFNRPQRPESIQLNTYYWDEHLGADRKYGEVEREDYGPLGKDTILLMEKIIDALNDGNHDNSDLMTDYHDVGWYVNFNIGRWNKPYINSAAEVACGV